MKLDESTREKLRNQLHALQWWAQHLSVPLVNGEKILFEMIIDNMSKLLKE